MFGEVLVAAEVGPTPSHLELLGGHELLPAHLREVCARHAQKVLRQLESLNDGNLFAQLYIVKFLPAALPAAGLDLTL